MQNRFQFRVWDKKRKKMLIDIDDGDGDQDETYADDWNTFQYALGAMTQPGAENNDDRDYAMMQFTGLKDKNGKEIFESDIIKAKSYGSEEIFCMEWIGETGCGCHNGLGYYIPSENNPPEEWEVIGNIYENPELLNKQKSE
jgi:hypothetical protein